MRCLLHSVFATGIVVLMIAGPISYKRWHDGEWRNFRVVEPGVLYRSGQMSPAKLEQVVALHGIRTIVSLRDGDAVEDQAEEAWTRAKTLNFHRLPMPDRAYQLDAKGQAPADAWLQAFREVMDDPGNYPVLVHCFAGIHRTGAMCAVFRMDYQGWTNDEAMSEMRVLGYTILDDHEDILEYLSRYRAPSRSPGRSRSVLPVSRQSVGNP